MSGKVTFICDRVECSIGRTEYKSRYDSSAKHYCSKECRDKSQGETRGTKLQFAHQRRADFIKRWERMIW